MHPRLFVAVAFIGALGISTGALAESKLRRAEALFEGADDEAAATVLRQIVAEAPRSRDAAEAHIYLGLIALNAIDSDKARNEFEQAIRIEPLLELPRNVSPKARLLFEDIRRNPFSEQFSPPAPPTKSAVAPQATAAREANGPPSHLPAVLTFGLAAAALGTGIAFGAISLSDHNGAANPVTSAHDAYQLSQGAADNGRVADILFGVSALAAIAGGVLLATELLAQPGPTTSTAAAASGWDGSGRVAAALLDDLPLPGSQRAYRLSLSAGLMPCGRYILSSEGEHPACDGPETDDAP